MNVNASPHKLVVIVRAQYADGHVIRELYEGELPVADHQDVKGILGDGKARVTVSRELSENDYGNGGKVFVSVSLACDQSTPYIDAAAGWANCFTDKYVREYHLHLRKLLAEKGILIK